jgi:phage-related minor tail protein
MSEEIGAIHFKADTTDLERAQKQLEKLGQTGPGVEAAAKKIGESIGSIGDGGQQAAQKVDGASRSIIDSIKKTTAASEAGEKSVGKFYEVLGKPANFGGDVLSPYLDQLKKADTAQNAAVQSLGKIGMSAKATEAALRGVPAQFTDIVVSLQGGMNPMTVFLQQGGQLKDMFGGAGAAAKALGGYILGLVNPFTVAAAAAGTLAVAYYQGSKEVDALRLSLVTTGNAAGASVAQLQQFASQMAAISGTERRASSALASFVSAGVRGTDSLKEFAQAALDWERATGTSVEKTAKAFASLQDEPLKAAMDLQKGMNFLTVATYEEARALEEQGRKTEAAALLQREYAKTLNQGSTEIRTNLGFLETSWDKLGKTASKVWDLMLGAGRASSLADKIAGATEDIAGMERQIAQGSGFGNTGGGAATGRGTARLNQQDIDALKERIRLRKEELATMQKEADQDKETAERRAAEDAKVRARDEWNQKGLKYLSDAKKMERELAQERELGVRAGYSEAEIQQRLTAIREEYAKKDKDGAKAAKEYNKELADQRDLYGKLAGLSSDFYKEWDTLSKAFSQGRLSLADLEKEQAKLLAKQPFMVAATREEEKARRDLQKAIEDDIKQADRLADKRQAAIKSAEDAVRKARQEEEAHALAAAANITLAEAVERLTIARLEEQLQMARMGTESQATIDALERELAARKELLGVLQQKGFREGNKKAADEAAKDWDKTAQTISRTLSDYIMSGGKDAAQYLKRLFATLVLEPIVQYGVSSLLGMGGQAASVASGGLNPLSMLSGGKSAMGIFGGGAGAGFMNGLGAWGSGGSVTGVLTNPGLYTGAELLGTVAPILLGGIALFKILSGDWFGSRGPNHSGGVASTATTDRDLAARQALGTDAWGNTLGDFTSRKNEAIDKQLDTTVKGMLDMYKALAKIGGVTAREVDIAAGFSTNPKHGDEGAMGFFQIIDKLTGEVLTKYKDRELDADPQKAWAQFVGDMGGALVAEIKKGDIPGWMREELDALGDDVTVEGLTAAIQKIAVIDASFKNWANTLVGFNDLSAKAQTALLKFSGGIEALTGNINAFYAGFYSEAERAEILQRQVREQLKGLGVDIDPKDGEAAKKAFRKLIEDALASGNTELAAKLLALAQMFGVAADYAQKAAETAADAAKTAADEAVRALEEAKQKAKDAALANFEAAVAREQEYWQRIVTDSQAAVQAISSILTPLKQSAKELFGSIDAAQQMQAVQGMVYIEQALAGVRGGAKLSSFDGLTDAITAARGGITSGRYASQFERDRDALVLANQLSQIAGYGDTQLSVEERQLKNSQEQLQRLDKTLTYWRDLLDGNKSQIDATLSVEAAIKALEALLFPEKPTTTGGGGGGKTPTPDWGGGGGGGFQPANSGKYKTPTAILGGGAVIYDYAAPDYEKRLDSLAPTFEKYRGTGDFTGLADDFRAAGGTAKDLAYLYGFTEADVLAALDRNGIPRFDVGTNRVPQDMLAMVHKNEAIVPAAFNPWAGGTGMGGGNNNARLEALVAQLIDENRTQAGKIVRLNSQVARLLQRWDGDGMPQPRKEGEGVAA